MGVIACQRPLEHHRNHRQNVSVAMTWAIFPGDKYKRAVIEIMTAAQQPSGSERIMVIVGGSLLEEAVNFTLRERLLNEPSVVDNLTGVDRALGNMGPKIDLLYLLGAIDQKTRGALKGLASVRNFFAHHIDASFDSLNKEFNDAMRRLTLHEGRTHYPHHLFGPDSKNPIEPVHSRRDQFIVNLKLGLIALMRHRTAYEAHTNHQRSEAELLAIYPDRYKESREQQV
jgi:hypothetical protein